MAFIMVLHEKHEPLVGWGSVHCACEQSVGRMVAAVHGWMRPGHWVPDAAVVPNYVQRPCLQDKMVHWLLFVNMALVAIMLFVDLAVR